MSLNNVILSIFMPTRLCATTSMERRYVMQIEKMLNVNC